MTSAQSRLRALHRWWRLAAPPSVFWIALALVVGLIEAVVFWIAWLLGDWTEAWRLHEVRDVGVIMFAVFYGVLRVMLHHPLFNASYRNFLAMTPWERGKPLPLGPVRLALQDALVVGLLILVMSVQNRLPLVYPATAFLIGYLLALGPTLWKTGSWFSAWCICFGLGLTMRLSWWNPWAAAAALAATAAVTQYGLWQSWVRFPWLEDLNPPRRRLLDYDSTSIAVGERRKLNQPYNAEVLWPQAGLKFSQPERLLDPWRTWLWIALVGWWLYAVFCPIPPDSVDVHKHACAAFSMGSIVIALCRFVIYAMAHHPPISILGRIATKRYLIPEYDVVLVTPLLVAMMGVPTYFALYFLGIPAVVSLAITSSLVIGLACTGGPRLRTWQLTAPCRIMATTASSKELEQI